jgi:hypothetical protein
MFDARKAIENFRKRRQLERAKWSEHRVALLDMLPLLAETLRRDFGATEIWRARRPSAMTRSRQRPTTG